MVEEEEEDCLKCWVKCLMQYQVMVVTLRAEVPSRDRVMKDREVEVEVVVLS